VTVILCLVGCGGDTPQVSESQGPTINNVPDPAMDPPQELAIAKAVKIDVLPTALTLDEEQNRIFVPEMGWMPLEEFWHIYESNPARLPASLDFRAVHQIRLSLADKDHDEA
jgi:hypothetical protein